MQVKQWIWNGGLAVIFSLAVSLPGASADDEGDAPSEAPLVGWLELSGELPDGPPPFAWVAEADAGPTLRTVLKQLGTVAQDEKYRGVVLSLNEASLSLSQIDEISFAIKAVRAAGKRVVVYAEQFDLPTYVLACSADTILLQHMGEVNLAGLGVEEMYLAGLLEKIGLEADLLQVGKFKGADESFMRTGPSEAWSSNMDALLDDLYAQLTERIAAGRNMSVQAVEDAIAQSTVMADEQIVRAGLVDALTDHELEAFGSQTFGDEFEWDDAMGVAAGAGPKVDNPFALLGVLFAPPRPAIHRQSLAIINALGPITSGESEYGGGIFGSETIGSRTMIQTLCEARDDDAIKGIVIRIDSPGGSALASEMVWQAVRDTAAFKPVFVSVGSMAASGGYYIACAGDRIYVTPTGIVGSIGVVGGKIVMGGLYEKLGVSVYRRSRGPLGDMFNSVEKFDDEQRAVVLASMQRVYEQFKQRVRKGRGAKIPDVEAVAAGRIFTGQQAVASGLADEIGGVNDALSALAVQLELAPGSYDIVTLPPAIGLGEFIEQFFNAGTRAAAPGLALAGQSPILQTARAILGERAWAQISRAGTGILQLQSEPVLTLMPSVLIVK